MSNNQKLFKDAIADAKALREVAIANAKAALEESFSPRIQSMFEKRIMETEELDEEEELDEKVTYQGDKDNLIDPLDETMESEEEAFMEGEDVDLEELFNSLSEEDMTDEGMGADDMYEEEESMDEEYDIDEILRELEEESLEENEEEMEEGKKEEDEDLNENTMFEKASNDEEIKDVTVEELRDLIRDAIKAAMGDAEMGSEDEDMETMDLDMDSKEGSEDEMDIDLDMDSEDEDKDSKKKSKKDEKDELDERRRSYKGIPKMKEDLDEAIKTINILRKQLNEVNLLNAKLIYVNRIFKANSLNESQKVKVVNSFDKAQTLNEAKNIYEVLKDNIKASNKSKAPLRESKQFASTVVGGKSAKQPILESSDVITRMQKLAGII